MKAVLHESPLERYESVFEGQKIMEVSGETVVPDKMPDIGLLGDANAHVLLRSKRTEIGCAIMEGELSVSVCYIPDGGNGFHVLQMQFPWQTEFASETIVSGNQIVGQVRVAHLETRVLNPRKILVKAKLEAFAHVYEQRKTSVCDRIIGDETVQVRKQTVECSVISTVCERAFAATDEYPLPADMNGGEVIGKSVQFRVEDVKTLTNKLIVKGSVLSDVIIASENGVVERVNFTSAFSFIAETDCEQVSDNVSMAIIPTAMYYELTSNGRVLSVEVHGVCQMTVYAQKTVSYLSDAYSNFYPCIFERDSLPVYRTIKRGAHRENLSSSIACRSQLSCVRFLTVSYTVEDEGVNPRISILVGACVQYENGVMDWVRKQLTLPLKSKDGERLWAMRIGDLYGSVNGSELEIRLTADWESVESSTEHLEYITAVTWDEEQEIERRKPSLTVVRNGGELWELARRFGSTTELIRTFNQLSEEDEHADTMLLIPTQRK